MNKLELAPPMAVAIQAEHFALLEEIAQRERRTPEQQAAILLEAALRLGNAETISVTPSRGRRQYRTGNSERLEQQFGAPLEQVIRDAVEAHGSYTQASIALDVEANWLSRAARAFGISSPSPHGGWRRKVDAKGAVEKVEAANG